MAPLLVVFAGVAPWHASRARRRRWLYDSGTTTYCVPSRDLDVAPIKPSQLNEAEPPGPAACPAVCGITPAAASAPQALADPMRPG
jgi:hypothetical protein